MSIEAMKLAFESWARPKWTHREDFDQRIKAKPGTYNNFEVQAAWEAWQAALSQQPAPGEPVYWEWRHLSTHPDTVDFGKWSEWKRVEARSAIHTIDDALAEFRAYIAHGYKYELRALYTTQQPTQATQAEAQQPSTGEPVAALVRSRRIRTPAHCAFDKKDHYSEWSDWEPCTLSYARAVTDPARDRGLLPLYEMLPLYTHPAMVTESFAIDKAQLKSMTELGGWHWSQASQLRKAAECNKAAKNVEPTYSSMLRSAEWHESQRHLLDAVITGGKSIRDAIDAVMLAAQDRA